MDYKYSFTSGEKMARAVVLAAPVSFKKSVEVCNFIRGKKVVSAITTLNKAALMQIAIPFRRFNKGGVGHRPGMGTGRFPVKACLQIIRLLEDAQANAQHKGLEANSLVIRHISAKKAEKSFHYGRQRRRLMKRTHIEVVLEQQESKAKPKLAKGQLGPADSSQLGEPRKKAKTEKTK